MPDQTEAAPKSPNSGSGEDEVITNKGDMINYIIAIGIDKYIDPTNNFEHGNCEKDCHDLIQSLTSNYCSFKPYKEPLINEKATKENIETLIKEFIDSEENNINNNLIIYFSGHGGIVNNGFSKVGCWIPHDCKRLHIDSVISNSYLSNIITQRRTQHVIIISDSCQSGKLFEQIRPNSLNFASGTIQGVEISMWAIVSSRSDQLSKAGGRNQNSKFTETLLKVFNDNQEQEFLVTELIGKLDKYFIHDKGQRPLCGRLSLQDEPNNGYFIFGSNKDRIKIRKRLELLEPALRSLNYDAQKRLFRLFIPEEKKQVVVFSGTPESGLYLISEIAKIGITIRKDYEKYVFKPPLTYQSAESRLLSIFNLAFNANFPNLDLLIKHIQSILEVKNLLFEFRFYSDVQDGITIPPLTKKQLIDQWVELINTINHKPVSNHKVFIFIIDEENSDYFKLYGKDPIGGINTILMPPVELLDSLKIEDWYISETTRNQNEFDHLMDDCIYPNVEQILKETGGKPVSTIRKICEYAKCYGLADALLYPKP
ncbi:hypothetical protein DBR11_14390 [Pedobacter sp. HMWF019]|uniref:caspase family protein n=1 Tax=Pedobacter sp. HMWF019 TaxID=2056856 RepID=UPI000D3BBBAF|nr:caspase family protein [Pedobacter sp. HMWF019]PTS98629.1 hypothetical protein DBR11_14390 [Pedobacter sp. HMWF019]